MRPKSEAELAEMLREAVAPISVRGGGTRAPVAATGALLETGGLSGITLYEPGALTLVAGAGTPLADVEAALVAEGQRLAFEPPDMRALLGRNGVSTIGGVVAANSSGPRRVQAGACRDSLIGVRFVDGAGRVVKNGGRVMKNVTGYDLVKLMAGSHGALGVLTEVALKVLPVPETEASLRLEGLSADAAVKAMAAALGSPYEVTGAAHGVIGAGHVPGTVFRIEGFAGSVRHRSAALARVLGRHGSVGVEEDPAVSAGIWAGIRDVRAFRDHDYVARMSIRASGFGAFLRGALDAFAVQPAALPGFEVMLDWGGGLVWVAADAEALARHAGGASEPGVAPVARGAQLVHEHLQGYCTAQGGHATLVKAPEGLAGRVCLFQPEAPGVAALTQGIRAQFDPRGILNPGMMR